MYDFTRQPIALNQTGNWIRNASSEAICLLREVIKIKRSRSRVLFGALLLVLILGLTAGTYLYQLAVMAHMDAPSQSDRPIKGRVTAMARALFVDRIVSSDDEAALVWNDECAEFWNVISEPEVPREDKKQWVGRLFALDRERAYAYFSNNIYDFASEKEVQALIGEVCREYGLPAIVFYDKEEVREELSRFLSWKFIVCVFVGSPIPLLIALFAVRLFRKLENWVVDYITRVFFLQYSQLYRNTPRQVV